jgi:hypothetical protein
VSDQVNDNQKDKTEKDKSKFDWVTERSSCSLAKVFAALLQQVEADVKTRNALRPQNSPYEFSVAEKGDHFTAILKAKDLQKSVTFTLAEHAILVGNNNNDGSADAKVNPMFEVTVIFNDHGECKLYANEEQREFWQVRRMALEDLLFHHE